MFNIICMKLYSCHYIFGAVSLTFSIRNFENLFAKQEHDGSVWLKISNVPSFPPSCSYFLMKPYNDAPCGLLLRMFWVFGSRFGRLSAGL